MTSIMRRPLGAFSLGLAIAAAAFAGQQAWAQLGASTATATMHACVKTQNGQVRIVAVNPWVPDTINAVTNVMPPLLQVTMLFNKVTQTYTNGGITHTWEPTTG